MKWIYLARRSLAIEHTDFVTAWRRHARLAARFPALARYFQATLYCHGSAHNPASVDAIGILTVSDKAAIRAVLRNPDAVATMHSDELRVFEDVIARLSIAADEDVISDGPHGHYVELLLLEATAMARPVVDQRVFGACKAHIGRCVVNHVVPDVFPVSQPWTAVVELHGDTAHHVEATADRISHAFADIVTRVRLGGPTILDWRSAKHDAVTR